MEKLGINLAKHHENTALIVRNDKSQRKLNYAELLRNIVKCLTLLKEYEDLRKGSNVGIIGDKSIELVTITLGIIETGFSFYYMTKEDLDDIEEPNVEYFFSLSQIHINSITLQKTLTLYESTVYFYKFNTIKGIKEFNDANDEMNQVCYSISTSGTTARRKLIHVTYNSIYANLISFSNIFSLGHSDVILSSSPITFDVFILDLFFSLYSGSALLFNTNSLRFDVSIFSKDSDESVTFLQMTPTIFKQYGLENIQNRILHPHSSSLKYLVLGGEEFPSAKEVLSWQNWNDRKNCKRIFNIYGITELSCWALIHEVTKDDLNFGKVPLGNPLDKDTILAYNPTSDDLEELLLITSSRVNFFDNNGWDRKLEEDNKAFAYNTNDLVKKIDGKIYWHGRSNDIVKRFGQRVNLKEIEDVAAEIIVPVSCVMIKKRIVLFYQSINSEIFQLLTNHLKLKLNKSKYPDDIKRIEFLPTCEHGKISKKKLKELYRGLLKENNIKQSAEEIFLDAINQMFNLNLENPIEQMETDEHDGKRMKYDIDSTFQQIGGTSFDALRIVMQIEDKMNAMSNSLLPKLLDNQHTIKDVFKYLESLKINTGNKDFAELKEYVLQRTVNLKILKKIDLKKCIDSSPALITVNDKKYVAVGSHSGVFVTINADDLSIVSTIFLNDRIECEAVQLKNLIIIGCYDGNLYGLDAFSQDESNRIKLTYNSGAMIKSKPLVINNEFIIFGNYNYEENLRCLYVDEKLNRFELKWSNTLGKSGIFANILKIDQVSFIACSLDGVIGRLKINDGSKMWNRKYDSPIFSSPQKMEHCEAVIFAEVMRKIHCVDYNGNELWKFDCIHGHMFSSFTIDPVINGSVKILFGCHDNYIRCLNSQKNNASLEWETKLQSQIFSTPKIATFNLKKYVVSCSTNGYVNLINILDGKIEKSLKLPGEIFSSCLVLDNKIFIGCRDNFLYCLSF